MRGQATARNDNRSRRPPPLLQGTVKDPSSEPPNHGFTSVSRVSPTLHVREQLLAAIERGEFLPGSALPSERALCETFGVSRVSVREAIAGIEAMGLITVQHGRGAFIRALATSEYAGPFAKYLQLHRHELVQLLKVRGALDELAAEEAALHGTRQYVAHIQQLCDRFREQAEREKHEFSQLAELDVAFHIAIAEASKGELLTKLLRELNGLLVDSRKIMFGRDDQPKISIADHQLIVDAIARGDVRAARQAVHGHVEGIWSWIESFAP
jgi:GntR family transcriptional repressor for pyruvate dehydrogenase complex